MAVVGRASVGKSTLVNAVLGEKISIVSPVPQTTRNLVRGVLTDQRGQLVLLDTPGVHRAASDLGRVMNRSARASVDGCDAVMLVLDGSTSPREEDEGWMRRLAKQQVPVVMVINKSDCGCSYLDRYLQQWESICSTRDFPVVFTGHFAVSALQGRGLETLIEALFMLLPEGPLLFPEDVLSDFPKRWAVSDLIREKLFGVVYQELPHALAVRVTDFVQSDTTLSVKADILVNRATQKPIVLGRKGRTLRKVIRQVEAELATLYACDVSVELWVRIEPGWSKNHWILKELGYVW